MVRYMTKEIKKTYIPFLYSHGMGGFWIQLGQYIALTQGEQEQSCYLLFKLKKFMTAWDAELGFSEALQATCQPIVNSVFVFSNSLIIF